MKLNNVFPFVCLSLLLTLGGVIIRSYSASHLRPAQRTGGPDPIVMQHGVYTEKLSRDFKSRAYRVTQFEGFEYYALVNHAQKLNDQQELRELEAAHRRHDLMTRASRSSSGGHSSLKFADGV